MHMSHGTLLLEVECTGATLSLSDSSRERRHTLSKGVEGSRKRSKSVALRLPSTLPDRLRLLGQDLHSFGGVCHQPSSCRHPLRHPRQLAVVDMVRVVLGR